MPRAWLLPIGRLHRLSGRELATGCRSWWDGSCSDLSCCHQICTSAVIPDDTVGCTRPLMKDIADLKDGSQGMGDCTWAPLYPGEKSEVSPHTVGFTSQPVKAASSDLESRQHLKDIAPLKGGAFGVVEVQDQYKSKIYESNPGNTRKASNQGRSSFSFAHDKCRLIMRPMTFSQLYVPKDTRKGPNQNLPFVVRRNLSTNSSHVQNSSMYGPGDRTVFDQDLKSAHKKHELDVQVLKKEFASLFRPQFAANCLLLPGRLTDHSAAYLHGQVHGLTKNWPLYLSSLDFMERVKSFSKDQVQHFVNYIIKRRILISEDWVNSYGNIQVLRYEPSADASFVRGIIDAAFEKLSGVAKIAVLIFKGNELIFADVIEGLPCKDSVGGEVLAGLAVLMKCKELGFQKLELWTDSSRVVGVLTGSESIPFDDKNRKNCLLLRCLQTEFTELVPVLKHREVMFLPDQVLKLEGPIDQRIEKAMEEWSAQLNGQTLFCVSNTKWTSNVIKSFAKTRMTKKQQEGYVYKPDRIFFWKVEKGEKFAALSKLRDVFRPDVLSLAVHKFEEKPAFLRQMISEQFQGGYVLTSGSSGPITTYSVIRNMEKSVKKPIVVVWDSCLYQEHYEQESCIVVLVEDEDEVRLMKSARINEMNISTYLYFNGVEFKEKETV